MAASPHLTIKQASANDGIPLDDLKEWAILFGGRWSSDTLPQAMWDFKDQYQCFEVHQQPVQLEKQQPDRHKPPYFRHYPFSYIIYFNEIPGAQGGMLLFSR